MKTPTTNMQIHILKGTVSGESHARKCLPLEIVFKSTNALLEARSLFSVAISYRHQADAVREAGSTRVAQAMNVFPRTVIQLKPHTSYSQAAVSFSNIPQKLVHNRTHACM